jgi:D-serine deaminase-like pyridoxal phosphate-dependent protein
MPFALHTVVEPTLLLNESICKANIQRMAEKARQKKLAFYPHFKTHQSRGIGKWCSEAGLHGIAVSSVAMAEYFSNSFRDITIAVPLNIRAIPKINHLAQRTGITLMLSNVAIAKALVAHIKSPVRVFIELDAGYHRTGIEAEEKASISAIIEVLNASAFTSFRGFYIHPGNSYGLFNWKQKAAIHEKALYALRAMKETFHREGMEYRLGDTPNCSLMEDFDGVTSIGPGNYVFYDAMMAHYGNCSWTDIAVCLAAPVLETHPLRQELIVHAGAVHLSKDYFQEEDGTKNFGWLVRLTPDGWSQPIEGAFVKKLSQEHGIIHLPSAYFNEIHPGELIGILPVHSCLTASCMKGYLSNRGQYLDHAEA